jgi:hypothetical protein
MGDLSFFKAVGIKADSNLPGNHATSAEDKKAQFPHGLSNASPKPQRRQERLIHHGR